MKIHRYLKTLTYISILALMLTISSCSFTYHSSTARIRNINENGIAESQTMADLTVDEQKVMGSSTGRDLRGMFLRGAQLDRGDGLGDPDVNSRTYNGTNSPNAPGSYEPDAFKSHNHSVNFGGNLAQISANSGNTGNIISSQSAATTYSGGNETRPQNVYVNYIIKY